MDQKPRSRKRNIVKGNVSEIKRSNTGLGLDSVGERADLITRIIRRRKERRDND